MALKFRQKDDGSWEGYNPEDIKQKSTSDYSNVSDEQLIEIATEKGIDITKAKTRAQLIKLLEK